MGDQDDYIRRGRDVETVARAMHEALCGSWEAAGFEVKASFLVAAMVAIKQLADDGWDIFSYPDGGWNAR